MAVHPEPLTVNVEIVDRSSAKTLVDIATDIGELRSMVDPALSDEADQVIERVRERLCSMITAIAIDQNQEGGS